MYSTKDRTKIGKVTIDYYNKKDGQYIRLRFTYPKGTRNEIAIGRVTEQNVNDAIAKAGQINRDIALDNFDTTLTKYDSNRQSVALEVVKDEGEPTVKDLWEQYKAKQEGIAEKTTQNSVWKNIDSLLDALPKKALLLENLDAFGSECLKIRALSSVHRASESLQAAVRQRKGYEGVNLKSQLPKRQKKIIEWYEPNEVQLILESLRNNRYCEANNGNLDSYYYPYAAFCAYTGCRPEEAIALTWNDLYWSDGNKKCQVKFNKAFSKGILKASTKNHLVRIIPLSSKLISILEDWKKENKNDLVFPARNGGYLNQDNYRKRIWYKNLDGLLKSKVISKKLKPYCLRHSFVTNLHYEHKISLTVIAGLIGDLVKTTIENYTGLKPFDAGEMPNIY